jgi:hypothetical protein
MFNAEKQRILDAFRQREPRLTDPEKKEISELQARIEHLTPISQKLLVLLEEKDSRLRHLERGGAQGMVIANLDVLDAVIVELISLKPSIMLLQSAFSSTSQELSQADSRIRDIKEKARERELREERTK